MDQAKSIDKTVVLVQLIHGPSAGEIVVPEFLIDECRDLTKGENAIFKVPNRGSVNPSPFCDGYV